MKLNAIHFEDGYRFDMYHKLDTLDVTSEEVQIQILDFQDKMARCYLCSENWLQKEFEWRVWYKDLHKFVSDGDCLVLPGGLTPFQKTIPSEIFYFCLEECNRKKKCKQSNWALIMSQEGNPLQRRILAARDRYYYKRIENASVGGIALLRDLRRLSSDFGYGKPSFEWTWRFYDFELFNDFYEEFAFPLGLSFVAVLCVILVITSDITATLVVATCVIMTDLFVAGLIFYWHMALNPIVLLQVILGIGCSVDYSAHIAYAYLVEEIPDKLESQIRTKQQIRKYKAEQALAKMGSSVFHGGFSTFVSLSVLAPTKTYIFQVFYKMWFGIILFGMANGFLLLPVILSFVGTVNTVMEHSKIVEEGRLPTDHDLQSEPGQNDSHEQLEMLESESAERKNDSDSKSGVVSGHKLPYNSVAVESCEANYQ